jgi:hypothetical protein
MDRCRRATGNAQRLCPRRRLRACVAPRQQHGERRRRLFVPAEPQGLEKGHLTDVTLAFTTPTDLAALMQTVTSTQYRACISEEVQSEAAATGVTITGAATAAVVPLPAPLHGLHLHISFPYTFSGQTKVAQDEVICLTSGRLRARLELDTCCTPFSATMVDQLMSRAAAKLQASGSR